VNETELLRRFVEENAQDAFAELVRNKINLVYATALRQVGGDSHLAEDVTQGVFLALACQAEKLKRHEILTGWLYTTTRFLAAKALRGRRRWQRREMEANIMNSQPDKTDAAWQELRPVIDDAMHELGENDRAVVLLRFFEGRSFAEVGAVVGATENAARMRVERALEKLRGRLARRGITSTAAALGAVLASQPVIAAPASLASAVTSTALGGVTAVAVVGMGGVAAFLNFMSTTKLLLGTVGAIVVFGVAAFVGGHSLTMGGSTVHERATTESEELARLRGENGQLKEQLHQIRSTQSSAASSKDVMSSSGSMDASAAPKKWALLAELYKQKLMTSRLSFVDNAGTLNPAIASVFDLTPDEHATLSQAIGAAREKLETLERANATVTRQPDGNVVIEIKPFPAAGGPVYDELMASISQALGPDRNEAFMTICADQVEKALGSFGATERKVTITSQPDSKHSRYLATDERIAPGNHSKNTSNYSNRDALLSQVGTITKLLPSDF